MSATPYPTQPTGVPQQSQIIVQQPEKEYHSFVVRKAVSTGGTQLVLGVLAIIFQICATAIDSELGDAAGGIWAGFFFLVAGCIGLTARNRRSCCKITFYGIFSLMALLCAIALLILAGIGLENDSDEKQKYCRREENWDSESHEHERYPDEFVKYNARMAMNAMLVIFALIEIVVAVYAIVICVQGCCGGKSSKHAAVPVVAPVGQAVVVYPDTNAQRQYIAYPQAQPLAPPAYDATAPPAYVYYESGSSQAHVVPSGPPPDFNNPTYQVHPPHNIYASDDNTINENKKMELE